MSLFLRKDAFFPAGLSSLVCVLAACAAETAGTGAGAGGTGKDTSGAALPEGAPPAPTSSSTGAPPPPAPSGPVSFTALTYNVAGLPQGISKSNPLVNTKLISPKLNPFQLVLVQEDFTYHADLISAATHPYKTTPMQTTAGGLNDGLNALTTFAFVDLERTGWTQCNGFVDNGNDCLAKKGFTRFVAKFGTGLEVDVYDVHFDASRSDGDVAAREAQVTQIVAVLNAKSAGRPVILAGDTNMKASDEATVARLISEAGLTDACRSLGCPETDRIDRVMFRDSSTVHITATSWTVLDWTTDGGEPLSDHEPVQVELTVAPK